MKSKFYVSAIYTSPPITMGGNTKILLELINHLNSKFDFVILTTEPATFRKHIKKLSRITIVPIKYPFKKFNYFSHRKEITYLNGVYSKYFKKHPLTENDYFYSCSDFAPDVLPVAKLKEMFSFIWIGSLFLFIPNAWENIRNDYKFPVLKYIIYYFYQKFIFSVLLKKVDLFLITNDFDRKYFDKSFKSRILAIYGGVNTEYLKDSIKEKNGKKYDAVFCSRLHPQKGISQLLDIWAEVLRSRPKAVLAILGNGDPLYEKFLHDKAKKLGIENSVEWKGYVDHKEKYLIYKQSKVLLHATIYDNNGMVAAEALSSGLPVVLYDLPALRKIYTTGCVKIKQNDRQQFAKTVIKLLTTRQYYARIKPNKKDTESIQKIWDWENRAALFDTFLSEAKIK